MSREHRGPYVIQKSETVSFIDNLSQVLLFIFCLIINQKGAYIANKRWYIVMLNSNTKSLFFFINLDFYLFKELALGRFFHRVAMCVSVLSPFYVTFSEASHWPSGHMFSSRPLIGQPSFTTKLRNFYLFIFAQKPLGEGGGGHYGLFYIIYFTFYIIFACYIQRGWYFRF